MSIDLMSPRGCLEHWLSPASVALRPRDIMPPAAALPYADALASGILPVARGLRAVASSGSAGERLRLIYAQRIADVPDGASRFPRCYHLLDERVPRVVFICSELAPCYEGLEAVTLEAGEHHSLLCLVFRRVWRADGVNRQGFVVAAINNDGYYGFHVRVSLEDSGMPVVKLVARDYSWRFCCGFSLRDLNNAPGWEGAAAWLARSGVLYELESALAR